ncbi:MAG: SRPBCC family protein [Actinomycetota bacterium]
MRPHAKHPYVIEDEITVVSPPHAVVAEILDATKWPRWQSEIRSISGPERIQKGDEIRGDARLVGFDVEGLSHALEVGDGTFVEDVIVGVRMKVAYRISDNGGRTVIRRRLEANLPGGVLGRVLTVVLKRKLRRMQKEVLANLAAQASEGS